LSAAKESAGGAAPPKAGSAALIVALGGFATAVIERLRPARPRQVLLALDHSAEIGEHVAAIVQRAEGLLGFGAAVATDAGDERRPALDVFIVASLGDEGVAKLLPELVSLTAQRLLSRFSNIFPGHDLPNLTICPVVALIGMRAGGLGAAAKGVLAELEKRAEMVSFKGGDASPVARVFVVEQQASRYELTPAEVASTVLAFLRLCVGSELRHEEPLRSFLRSAVDHRRDKRVFASFGCATLELNLHDYCVVRGALELVEGMRATSAAAVAEQAVFAQRLVPEPKKLTEDIGAPTGGEDLVAVLRAHTPQVEFPAIGEDDTPEQIRDVAYGWGWFEALERAVEAQVKRLDEREMDEVTRVADERGLKRLRSLQKDVKLALRQAETAGPHGWAQALRLAEQVRDRARRFCRELGDALRAEKLPAFPKPTEVESAFRELRDESTLRPRPYRMAFFGALTALVAGALLHHLPKWLVVSILAGKVSPFALEPSSMAARVGWLRFFLDPPYAFVWCSLMAGALIAFFLQRHRVRSHRRLMAAQAELKAAVRRYLADDVGPSIRRYYESRLAFTLRAWALRALARVGDLAAREVERLSAVAAALDRLGRDLGADARKAERAAEAVGGDLVYRTHVSAALLQEAYERARPGADLAATLFTELSDGDHEVPPYLLEEKLRASVASRVEPAPEALAALCGPVVVDFVAERHGKLGVPLEVKGLDERSVEQRYLFGPAWAHAPLEELRQRLRTLPEMREHGDGDRVHLMTLQTALSREAIVLTEAPP
jgi:hypothetical protein